MSWRDDDDFLKWVQKHRDYTDALMRHLIAGGCSISRHVLAKMEHLHEAFQAGRKTKEIER